MIYGKFLFFWGVGNYQNFRRFYFHLIFKSKSYPISFVNLCRSTYFSCLQTWELNMSFLSCINKKFKLNSYQNIIDKYTLACFSFLFFIAEPSLKLLIIILRVFLNYILKAASEIFYQKFNNKTHFLHKKCVVLYHFSFLCNTSSSDLDLSHSQWYFIAFVYDNLLVLQNAAFGCKL